MITRSQFNNANELLSVYQDCNGWEERYRLILQLGKSAQSKGDIRRPENEIKGCESAVWLQPEIHHDRFEFHHDSNSRMIRGLLFTLLLPVQRQSASFVREFDFDSWLEACGIRNQLSPTRNNGLSNVAAAVKKFCTD